MGTTSLAREPLAQLVRDLTGWVGILRQSGLRRRGEKPDDPDQDVRASDELEPFREPAKVIIVWLELHRRDADAAVIDDAMAGLREVARRFDAAGLQPAFDKRADEHLSPLDLLIQAASETASRLEDLDADIHPTFGKASTMREPLSEHVRRTLDVCRQNPARDVLSSRGWAQLREHCGELAVELDALGRRTIAQRVDRDYARLHEHLREAAAAAPAADGLLLADAIEELASTLAAIQRFRARASVPAGDEAALQSLGAESEPGPGAGRPYPTLTVATLLEWTNLSHTALNKYARLAGVQTPRRGQRNFRYGWADVRKILETVIANASDRRIRDKCRAALGNPPEITQ